MATKYPFRGTILSVDSTGGNTFVQVADVMDISPTGKKRGVGQSTVSDSPNDYRLFDVAGFKEGGQMKVKCRYTSTGYNTLDTIFEATTVSNWQFKFPLVAAEANNSKFVFLGLIEELGVPNLGVTDDDPWGMEFTVRISGKATFTVSS